MTQSRNIIHEYDSARNACLLQGGIIGAGVGIEYINLKFAFAEMRPEIPTADEARASFLEDNYAHCVQMLEDTSANELECVVSKQAVETNYQTVVLQAQKDLAAFNQNIAPYEGLATTGVALAFGAVAFFGILKPTLKEFLDVRAEVREIKEFLGIL